MKTESIIKMAEKEGFAVEYRKYLYWDVLFLNGTAMVLNHVMNNAQSIIQENGFPKFCTLAYIKETVLAGYPALGTYYGGQGFAEKKWFNAKERYELLECFPWVKCDCGKYFYPIEEVEEGTLQFRSCEDCREV